jgi:DNA polymerase (family 10)
VSDPRISLGRAHVLVSSIVSDLRRAGFSPDTLTPVGSLRRFSPDVGDVSLLATAGPKEAARLIAGFTRLPAAIGVLAEAPGQATIGTERHNVTLYVVDPSQAGAALVWHTGSREHVKRLARLAAEHGVQLKDGRLLDRSGTPVPCQSEEQLYATLGLPFIPPEIRHGEDEIDSALDGGLPRLISDLHIRGDLHMHSTWSDGRDSIEEMIRISRELCYEYIAITDHSQRAWSNRKLAVEDIAPQRAEIEALRARYPAIAVLHGIEVDIMKDGSLDFDDELLAGFDIVLASLHDHAGQSGLRLTERYLRAIESPFVDVITHPMNRAPGQPDAGYDLDIDRIFAAAAETGTAMEIDGAPGHLDMDGATARLAAAAGVAIVIDSDCHRAEWLGRQMRFGVGTARRGWIEPRHVLNTRPLEEIRAFVARKRRYR